MEIRRIAAGAAREQRDGRVRERLRLDPPDALQRQGGEHAPHLRPLAQRIAAAGQDQAAGGAHQSPAQQRDEVERRVVRPLQVLDDEHRGGRQLREGRRQRALPRARLDRREHRASDVARHVAQRTHRARRDQRIARPPQDAPRAQRRARGPHERRLADARLADDDHDPTRGGGLLDRRREDLPLTLTLKKLQRPLADPRRWPTRRPA
jgi:hypothetical protein